MKLTRRTLLKGAAAAGATGATGTLSAVVQAKTPKELDVAIIGGGVSGTYVAWSILARDPAGQTLGSGGRPRVGMFELSDRIGGRLWSTAPPGAPHLRTENGGMRYLERQRLVATLIDHLRIENRPFPFGGDQNLLYLRGKRFTVGDVKAKKPIPYDLSPKYRGLLPGDVFMNALESVIPNAAKMNGAEWLQTKKTLKVNGKPIHDIGLGALMRSLLKGDDLQYTIDGDGYDSGHLNVNAGDLAQDWFSDFVSPKYRRPVDGYEALPIALAKAFEDAGGHIERQTRLVRVDRLVEGGQTWLNLLFNGPSGEYSVRARRVVLAMPWRSIQLLDRNSFMFAEPQFVADLGTVTPIPALKIHLAYETPWWAQKGLKNGRSVTDLHLRQCLYFGTEKEAPNGQAGNDRSLLVASYCDVQSTGYWKRLQTRSPAPYPSKGSVPSGLECSAAAVAAIQGELSLVHGIPAPAPYWAVLSDWTRDPFGGGWHFWKSGVKSWEVMPRMRRPIADANLYVCGEAYSATQGWVEGALQSAERVLRDHLGLKAPQWIPADADLGP